MKYPNTNKSTTYNEENIDNVYISSLFDAHATFIFRSNDNMKPLLKKVVSTYTFPDNSNREYMLVKWANKNGYTIEYSDFIMKHARFREQLLHITSNSNENTFNEYIDINNNHNENIMMYEMWKSLLLNTLISFSNVILIYKNIKEIDLINKFINAFILNYLIDKNTNANLICVNSKEQLEHIKTYVNRTFNNTQKKAVSFVNDDNNLYANTKILCELISIDTNIYLPLDINELPTQISNYLHMVKLNKKILIITKNAYVYLYKWLKYIQYEHAFFIHGNNEVIFDMNVYFDNNATYTTVFTNKENHLNKEFKNNSYLNRINVIPSEKLINNNVIVINENIDVQNKDTFLIKKNIKCYYIENDKLHEYKNEVNASTSNSILKESELTYRNVEFDLIPFSLTFHSFQCYNSLLSSIISTLKNEQHIKHFDSLLTLLSFPYEINILYDNSNNYNYDDQRLNIVNSLFKNNPNINWIICYCSNNIVLNKVIKLNNNNSNNNINNVKYHNINISSLRLANLIHNDNTNKTHIILYNLHYSQMENIFTQINEITSTHVVVHILYAKNTLEENIYMLYFKYNNNVNIFSTSKATLKDKLRFVLLNNYNTLFNEFIKGINVSYSNTFRLNNGIYIDINRKFFFNITNTNEIISFQKQSDTLLNYNIHLQSSTKLCKLLTNSNNTIHNNNLSLYSVDMFKSLYSKHSTNQNNNNANSVYLTSLLYQYFISHGFNITYRKRIRNEILSHKITSINEIKTIVNDIKLNKQLKFENTIIKTQIIKLYVEIFIWYISQQIESNFFFDDLSPTDIVNILYNNLNK